jgi:hypothetical protein
MKTLFLVDELVAYDAETTGRAARHFGRGKESCHLIAAGDLEELHAFAKKLGLRREWFQGRASWPHYDLTPSKRAKALALGAIEVSAIEEAGARMAVKRRLVDQARAKDPNVVRVPLDMVEATRLLREYFDDTGKPKRELISPDFVDV